MKAPPILRTIYHEHIEHFGEPDNSIVFDDPPPPDDTFPGRIEVLIWNADAECDVTTFATIGMAARPMHGAGHRAELHFGIRAVPDPAECSSVAVFMANLAIYPFYNRTHFDWWHRVPNPGKIPVFPSCTSLFFHPRFVAEGWDLIEHEGTPIKILNVIPITRAEYDLGTAKALDDMATRGVDLLKPR